MNGTGECTGGSALDETRVVVIGSGASGTLSTIQLLARSSDRALRVILVEREERFARGLAYGTKSGKHLLNVPAGKISALPEDPDHLLRWLRSGPMPEAGRYSFIPRRTFGDYLEATLEEAEEASHARLERIRDEVVTLEPDGCGMTVHLASGDSLYADRVVLATGNLPARNPPVATDSFYDCPRYVSDAWSPGALSKVRPDESVLLIGTSLTAIDVVLSLKERGHRAGIHAVSRRGLVPNPHAASPSAPYRNFLSQNGAPPRLSELFRTLRYEARNAAFEGRHWQAVIDALRPETQELWARASEEDRRRFLRHVQPYWEVHRHRIAPEVGEEIHRLRERGEFLPRAGRIRAYHEFPGGVRVDISRRGGGVEELEVSRVVNCTGPHTDARRGDHPLLRALLRDGHARPGPLDLGLDTDDNGALLDSGGESSGLIYTLGAHRKGNLWETIAIPEIRTQAVTIAGEILATRSPRRRYGRRKLLK